MMRKDDLERPAGRPSLDEIAGLERRFHPSGGARRDRFRFAVKRFLWRAVTGGAHVVKRAIDIAASAIVLILLLPAFAVIVLLIKGTDGGPVLFWQDRIGLHGKPFRFPKFRSMVVNAEALKDALLQQNQHADGRTFKMKNDPRITWIGRIMRKLSIDELPQFWCVLKGEMSLVGPRPPVPREVKLYTVADRRRLDVTPGLTCIWQVSGRGDIPFPEQVQLDARYIDSQSFWLDIKLLLATVPAVLFGKGAY
jgi:lipopolysaccharide/colanic/teichoic acid biosynthesis glycosyltransferase